MKNKCLHLSVSKFHVDTGGLFLREVLWCKYCGAIYNKRWIKPKILVNKKEKN